MTQMKNALAALMLCFVSQSAFAQGSSIQSEPLDSPQGGKPVTQKPVTVKPAAQGGYVTTGDGPTQLNGTAQGYTAPTPAQTQVQAAPGNATSDEQDLLNRADVSLKYMRGNKDFKELDSLLARAKGVFIVPQLIKAAFFFGGEGGDGVIVARMPDGTWSGPSFSVIGSASFGLQAGAKSSEVVFVIMTDKGLNAILNRDVKLGADISVALITVGKGLGASTAIDTDADIYAVAKSDGLFGGAAFDGSVINPLDSDNEVFYGQKIEARDILNGHVPPPPGAQALLQDLR